MKIYIFGLMKMINQHKFLNMQKILIKILEQSNNQYMLLIRMEYLLDV